MPVAEVAGADADERTSYELAFHVLPTVAEGEVTGVFEALKNIISTAGGELTDEEAPERFDLAYEIDKMIEGKHRKFTSAYFGWVRFSMMSDAVEAAMAKVAERPDILRHMLVKLTRVEEAHPFRFHEALKSEKMVTTVEESEVVPDTTTAAAGESTETKKEDDTAEAGEVKEAELDESLEKITSGEEATTEEKS